jgi:ABC-type Mn2+/Zn2+ transport system ATPase subunit
MMVATHDLDQAATHFDRIMLLNHRIVEFGEPKVVMQTENLLKAYGGRMRIEPQGAMLVDDCCPPEE